MTQELLELIKNAESASAELLMPPHDIFAKLVVLGGNGSAYANYVLGRAQVGANCGVIAPHQLVPKLNYREGYTRLLRAAHGGEAGAWFELYRACANYRSVLANQTAALFFLEQAAGSGLLLAKTRLGVFTLLHAEELEAVLAGQRWLNEAAMEGDASAFAVLTTFLVPDKFSSEVEERIAGLIARTKDPELSLVLRVARAFRLTRNEAARVPAFKATRRSLVIKPSRANSSEFALPATTDDALELLFEHRQIAAGFSAGRAFDRRRAAALQKLLDTAGIPEEVFFVSQRIDLGPYRSIESWKRTNVSLLKSMLHRPEEVRAE